MKIKIGLLATILLTHTSFAVTTQDDPLLSSPPPPVHETCYQLSKNPTIWSRTPDLLCIEALETDPEQYKLSLRTGFAGGTVVATFHYELLSRARSPSVNEDYYGITGNNYSAVNDLSIRFDGSRNLQIQSENGVVRIGQTQFFYRTSTSLANQGCQDDAPCALPMHKL